MFFGLKCRFIYFFVHNNHLDEKVYKYNNKVFFFLQTSMEERKYN